MNEAEKDEQRRKWQAKADATGVEQWWRGERFLPAGVEAKPAPVPGPGSKVYKVITQRDEFFAGQFDPGKLEVLINKLASDGWRVVAVTTADVSTFWGSFWAGRNARQEMVVFLEKDAV
jgi:hypothetical protein